MASYRCFFIDHSGHIKNPAIVVEGDDDAAAIGDALKLALSHSQPTFEVWRGARRVFPPAAETQLILKKSSRRSPNPA